MTRGQIDTQFSVLQRLLWGLARRGRIRDRDEICCHGVTVAQCQALQALATEPSPASLGTRRSSPASRPLPRETPLTMGQLPTVTMGDLADRLGISVSTATRTIDPLVAQGLVARCVDPRDRRVCCVVLTESGRALQRTLAREAIEAEQAILDEIPESRRHVIFQSLEELCRALDRAAARPSATKRSRGGTAMQTKRTPDEIKDAVRKGYARAVSGGGGCCGPSEPVTAGRRPATALGYDARDLERLPEGVVASSFGCGNPVALAGLREGDVVLDIGSGAGIDCLLAAERVGPRGRVIGLDMTPEMIEKARAYVREAGAANIEFRLGDAEAMPLVDASVDWVLSNCVINLAPDKKKVFREIHRVLRPGGQISVSDIVLEEPLPADVAGDLDALVGCVAGAVLEEDYLAAVREAGLTDVQVVDRVAASGGGCECRGAKIHSVRITARKP